MKTMCPVSALCLTLVTSSAALAQERGFQLPTATEVFQLRSACAALGQKILENNFVGTALSQDQVSHYNPRTNRCFVDVTVQTADITKPMEYFSRYLFDGQTKQMLAFARIEKGKKVGMVYDHQHQTTNLDNDGWDDASAYIDAMMADDRK